MANWICVGKVMGKKAPKKGVHVGLGNQFKKLTVTLTVKDETGKVVAEVENPFLQVQDPRKQPSCTPEMAAKIPDFIKQELYLVVND